MLMWFEVAVVDKHAVLDLDTVTRSDRSQQLAEVHWQSYETKQSERLGCTQKLEHGQHQCSSCGAYSQCLAIGLVHQGGF